MAAVYKTIAKKRSRREAAEAGMPPNNGDIVMQDDFSSESDSEDEDEDDRMEDVAAGKANQADAYMPKTRVLMLTSRGVTHRHRHLLLDLASLLPHSHKETKLDTKKKSSGYNFLLNSLADLHSCNVIFFLEARKRGQDLYLWLARPPNGPTVKFAVDNLHTMSEIATGFTGNCLKGGRGIVVFDHSFDDSVALAGRGNEYRALIREMLRGVFCVPRRGVKGMKPFIDRVIGIYSVDGKIWIRVFEIRETIGGDAPNVPALNQTAAAAAVAKAKENAESDKAKPKDGQPEISLVEIGPRFVLTPIVILEGSFGGPVIYENREFVSPNQVRRELRIQRAGRYQSRQSGITDRTAKKTGLGLTTDGKENRRKDVLDNKAVFTQ